MALAILGPLEVHVGEQAVPIGAMQLRRFVALLLLAEGRPVSSSVLVESLWPEPGAPGADALPKDTAATLRTYASRLRKLLPERVGPFGNSRGYHLDLTSELVDAGQFETLLASAAAALPDEPDRALAELRTALAMWRGPALADFRDEDWATGHVVRLDELHLAAIERLADARLALGQHLELTGELESLVAEHPYRERFWAQLMLANYRAGRQADALRAYQRLREGLVDGLGVEPSRELVDLEAAILRQDPVLERVEAAVGVGARKAGRRGSAARGTTGSAASLGLGSRT
ncbi:MAG TPA: AfsR/SARP family transcriptional regulator, partial [Acidimicrobiales bacterium]|nr:AfsR/SARP family transcriptional regulator [Acidimicrobiales bacterium]